MKVGFVVPLTTWSGVALTEYTEVNWKGLLLSHEPEFVRSEAIRYLIRDLPHPPAGAAVATTAQRVAAVIVENFIFEFGSVVDGEL